MEVVTLFNDPEMEWLNPPIKDDSAIQQPDQEGYGGKFEIVDHGMTLKLSAPAKKDFWSKTFYSPLLIKSDGSGLLCKVPIDLEATINIEFEYFPKSQFDQAGLLVFLDDKHWMKCGIEFCDGAPRLSVVVCNEFSDWSTQPWSGHSVSLKVHKVIQSDSVVVEAAPRGSNEFQFVRIAHLSNLSESGTKLPWRVGPYAACPIAQKGCEAVFSNFSVGPREPSLHSAEL